MKELMSRSELRSRIREVRGFPTHNTFFRDIAPVLRDHAAMRAVTAYMAEPFLDSGITVVAALESKGFLLAPLLANALGVGVIMLRRPGRLPPNVDRMVLGPGHDGQICQLEIQLDVITQSDRVLLCDDLLSSGQTASCAIALLRRLGADIAGASFLLELPEQGGRAALAPVPVESVLAID